MARLESTAKAGFYPLPDHILPLITIRLKAPHGGRAFDPCSGNGDQIYGIGKALQIECYANELDALRASKTRTKLDELNNYLNQHNVSRDINPLKVTHDNARFVTASPSGFNLVYANPPYDTDHEDGRLEHTFVKLSTKWLQPRGVLVLVVPITALQSPRLATYLEAWYEDFELFRFPYGEYERFRQLVFIGHKRKKPLGINKISQTMARLVDPDRVMERLPLDVSPVKHNAYWELPPLLMKNKITFMPNFVGPDDAYIELEQLGIEANGSLDLHLKPDCTETTPILMPLKIGHTAELIAGGGLNNQLLEDGSDELLIKGLTAKQWHDEIAVEKDQYENEKRIQTRTQRVRTKIVTLTSTGEYKVIEGEDLSNFLDKWMNNLVQLIQEKYKPRYTFDMGEHGKRIGKRGNLFVAQKHVACALATRLETHRDALMIGEMGVGKTRTAIAVSRAIEAKRTLIFCEPHLVNKWARQAKMVVPEATIYHLKTMTDVNSWLADDGITFGIMKFTSARAGSGWVHAFNEKKRKPKTAGYLQYPSGQFIRDKDGRTLTRGIHRPNHKYALRLKPVQHKGSHERGRYVAAWQQCRAEKERAFGSYRTMTLHAKHNRPSSPLGRAKFPLATYIHKQFPNEIDLLIADEVQKLKGADSDQGRAFARLVYSSRKVLGLTGTIYGGKASSIFHMLYRMSPEIRKAFTKTNVSGSARIDVKKWVDKYGLLQEVITTHHDKYGKQSGELKSRRNVREAPGMSPHMIPYLLDRCAFLNLNNLGFALPDYEEIPRPVQLHPLQQIQLKAFEDKLGRIMRSRLQRGDKSLLGAYLWGMISMPDAPWRDETVIDPHTKHDLEPKLLVKIPGLKVNRLWPKEAEIIGLAKQEIGRNRNVLLLCQQTNTRDITGHWHKILTDAGLRPAVLKCPASEREAWINQQSKKGINVIIAHPRSVETGLDIYHYPTIMWMGTEYSVYTVMQASRRGYRIGQKKAVKVYFFYYEQSMQAMALGLIAKKAAAAKRVSGDAIATTDIADLAGDSVQRELLKRIQTGSKDVVDIAGIFKRELNNQTTKSSEHIGFHMELEDDSENVNRREPSSVADLPLFDPPPAVQPFEPLIFGKATNLLRTKRRRNKKPVSDKQLAFSF